MPLLRSYKAATIMPYIGKISSDQYFQPLPLGIVWRYEETRSTNP